MCGYSGPLFLVGSPRSGTKLLRDLLNRHSGINLCNPETHFIPYLFQKHGGDPKRFDANLDRLFADFDRMPFQLYSRTMGKSVMNRTDFEQLRSARTWNDAFEIILRFYSADGNGVKGLWGDKTPSYVLEMDLLKEIFPTARFLHIIRDPRDVVVSAKKAWGHNALRVARKWVRDMKAARQSACNLGKDYLSVYYENLLIDSETELRRISEFVERPFEEVMMTLAVPSENLGNAKGKRKIDRGNFGKYRQVLTPGLQKRVEEIVYDVIDTTPYELEYAERHKPLSPTMLTYLNIADGVKTVAHLLRRRGVVDGTRVMVGRRIQKKRNSH
ncbi:sulfotransferase family protein [Ruegeria atlantica]|uniref:sulfotransferase family protein n=1 Tax=Ruegeria atlantica TaxID=81569 RepID=UPI0020C36D2E|nr:sulfotransferase [Ruegeria atlantica]